MKSYELIKPTIELDLILSILINDNDAVRSLDVKLVNWEKLYILILRHKVVLQIYPALQVSKLAPQCFMQKLVLEYNKVKFNMLPIVGETMRISKAFTNDNLSYIMLKGVLLGDLLYGGSCHRQCKDIDIWVDQDQFYKARSILHLMGYVQLIPSFEITPHNQASYFKKYNDITLFHPIRKVQVELHYKQKFFGKSFYTFGSAKTNFVNLQSVVINTLDNNYHALYLMLHGTKHAWLRIRWLYDIYLLIVTQQCDIKEIYRLSKGLKSCDVVLQALWLVRDVFKLDDNFLNELLNSMGYLSSLLAKNSAHFIYSDHNLSINPLHFGLLGIKNKIIKSLLHL